MRGIELEDIKEKRKPSPKMLEFLEKVDKLCMEYGYSFYPSVEGWTGKLNEKGEYASFACIGNGEAVDLLYIEGDGIDIE